MSTRPVHLTPELADAVELARAGLGADELPRPGGYRSPLGAEARTVVAGIIRDGTYRRLVEAVTATDPEIADQ